MLKKLCCTFKKKKKMLELFQCVSLYKKVNVPFVEYHSSCGLPIYFNTNLSMTMGFFYFCLMAAVTQNFHIGNLCLCYVKVIGRFLMLAI